MGLTLVPLLNGDGGQALTKSVEALTSGMSSIFSQLSSLVQAEMEIELPMAECPQNIAAFGHLTRKDVDTDKIFMMRHRLFAVFLCKDVPKCADLGGFGRVVAGCIK